MKILNRISHFNRNARNLSYYVVTNRALISRWKKEVTEVISKESSEKVESY